jgi:DNA-binding transcriptional LysR family regulator
MGVQLGVKVTGGLRHGEGNHAGDPGIRARHPGKLTASPRAAGRRAPVGGGAGVPPGRRLARAGIVVAAELAGETWIVGGDSGGDPQFRAWPALAGPVIGCSVRGWPARLGLVAAGLGICLVPEITAPPVPAGVTTIGVEDPRWLGRVTLAVTPDDPGAEAVAIVDALRRAGEDIREGVRHQGPGTSAGDR